MGGLVNLLQEIYIRFMVWLGAEPPENYKHLLKEKPAPPKKPAAAKEPPPPTAPPQKTEPVPPPAVEPEKPAAVVEPEPPPLEAVAPPPEAAEPEPPAIAEPEPEPVAPPTETPAPATEAPASRDEQWLGAAEPVAPVIDEEISAPTPTAPVQLPFVEEEKTVAPPAPAAAPPAAPPTPAEAAPIPPPPGITTEEMVFRYEFQRGDTLNAVARRYGLTVKDLLEANDLADPTRIAPGQKLVIPGYMLHAPDVEVESVPVTRPAVEVSDHFIYTVTSGDTLNSIAKRYGITLRELIEANDLADPNRIKIGQKLTIPGILKAEAAGQPGVASDAAVKAVHLSYFAVGHPATRQQLLKLLDESDLNALVIDAKSDFGWLTYPTRVPLAREIGANRPADEAFVELLHQLKKQGVYTVARIVTFKDPLLAKSHPEWAVKTEQGVVWQDAEHAAWSDPFLQPVWNYNTQVAMEAAYLGFDEIQFDFLRFPTVSPAGKPRFSQPANADSRVAALTGFLSAARGSLDRFKVTVSARVLGYTCWRSDDYLIGQQLEQLADYLDVVCPMLYPSTFDEGVAGYQLPVAHPYEVVRDGTAQAVERVSAAGCRVRPWIQDFQDYRFDKRAFGPAEIQAQIRGCFEGGAEGYMAWNPDAKYVAAAYAARKTPA